MATSTVTITGNVRDAIAGTFDARRTKVYVKYNASYVSDPDAEVIRFGSATVPVADDGSFSLPDVIASVDTAENLQATVIIDYADPVARDRKQEHLGPYDLTSESGTVDVTALEQVQALDPVRSSVLLTQMTALRDEQVALSGIDDTDSAVAYAAQYGATLPGVLSASLRQGEQTWTDGADDGAVATVQVRFSPDDGTTSEWYFNKPLTFEGYFQVLGDTNSAGEMRARAGGFSSVGLLEEGIASLLWVKNAGSARMDWGEGAAEAPTVYMSLDTAVASTSRWALWDGAGHQKVRWNSTDHLLELAAQGLRIYSDNFGTGKAEIIGSGSDCGLGNFYGRGIRTRHFGSTVPTLADMPYGGEIATGDGCIYINAGGAIKKADVVAV